jgi:ribosomal protein S18 acetylase RimI-like enzyme
LIAGSISNSTHPHIRPLNPARDLGQLADLIEEAFERELTEGGMRVLREIRVLSRLGPLTFLLDGLGPGSESMFTGFVWEEGGRLLGNVSVSRPTGQARRWQISNVAVRAGYRRQGIARQLVEAALDHAAQRGGGNAYLFVRDDNLGALTLYAKLGFVEVDRMTELRRGRIAQGRRSAMRRAAHLHPLPPARGGDMYALVRVAEGAGPRWLAPPRRRQFAPSTDDRVLRWIESLFTGERTSQWAMIDGDALRAGAVLRHTRLWNRSPHRLRLWVHPEWRGRLETELAADVDAILRQLPPRRTQTTLPDREHVLTDALLDTGFARVRTLILMRVDV